MERIFVRVVCSFFSCPGTISGKRSFQFFQQAQYLSSAAQIPKFLKLRSCFNLATDKVFNTYNKNPFFQCFFFKDGELDACFYDPEISKMDDRGPAKRSERE